MSTTSLTTNDDQFISHQKSPLSQTILRGAQYKMRQSKQLFLNSLSIHALYLAELLAKCIGDIFICVCVMENTEP